MEIAGLIVGCILAIFALVVIIGPPYVPSKYHDTARAFRELYPLSSKDMLVDIGSGDGVILQIAARAEARAVGFEINPFLVLWSRIRLRKQKNARVVMGNFWYRDMPSETTIVYTFGASRDITRMAAKVAEQATKHGHPIYLMSYAFQIKSLVPIKSNTTHFLYKIQPLQVIGASV